jgi:hypothetical protein
MFLPQALYENRIQSDTNQDDNGIETRIKGMRGPSTTNQYLSNLELRFPFTSLYLDEMFPTTAQQRK